MTQKQEKEYVWNAADYAKHSAGQQKWARELIAKLGLQGHETVLDLGCGDGKITAEIASLLLSGSILGVDNSPDMIGMAADSFPQAHYPNLSFRVVDARQIPFTERFDIVFSNATLHWVQDHRPVITGIAKSLKPGGRILLQMGGAGNAAGILATLDGLMKIPQWSQYFTEFTFPYGFHGPDEYKVWLAEAGLQPVRLELLPKDMIHQSKEGLAGWIRTTWLPYTSRLPEKLRDEFISRLVEKYVADHPANGSGLIHVAMIRLEVEATKTV
jgi:trans-aconitate methyltransferase